MKHQVKIKWPYLILKKQFITVHVGCHLALSTRFVAHRPIYSPPLPSHSPVYINSLLIAFKSDQLLAEQPWSSFRPSFSDAWISDLFTLENENLTKALQSSISGDVFSSEMLHSAYSSKADTTPVQTPTVSGVSSENEPLALATKQQRRSIPPSGRVAKRKPRPSKRAAATTFIAADPENFMQMVQQVTGVRIGGSSAPVLKPEARRTADGLPTLDTSAFLLDSSSSYLMTPASADGGAGTSEHYFDSFCSFPTLESWKAV